MKSPPRAVLDTNVVLSALVFPGGRLARLRRGWQQPSFQPLVSAATIEELVRALAYPKFKLSLDDRRELLSDYLPYCATVTIPSRPPRTPPCRDPSDVDLLQLAVVGNAEYLVTGDKDLLGVSGRTTYRIVAGETFLRLLDVAASCGQ